MPQSPRASISPDRVHRFAPRRVFYFKPTFQPPVIHRFSPDSDGHGPVLRARARSAQGQVPMSGVLTTADFVMVGCYGVVGAALVVSAVRAPSAPK
eukprot:3583298-Pleurochrysis_carterae.AAC.8